MKVLILGATGMLGTMVFDYLDRQSNFKVVGTTRDKKSRIFKYFEVADFLRAQKDFRYLSYYDYLINCIGVIKPFCQDDDPKGVYQAICVNALFPHRLASYLINSKVKIIQIATDCVYSGKEGHYNEDVPHDPMDVYGKTKSLGEVRSDNLLNIRCSIIGPEKRKKVSLLEWFLSQKEGLPLKGFAHHKWNGVTTLQFAQLCQKIIEKKLFTKLRKKSYLYHYVPNSTVTKYQLLNIFSQVFNKKHKITKVTDVGSPVDRTLSTKYKALDVAGKVKMRDAILELKKYIDSRPAFTP